MTQSLVMGYQSRAILRPEKSPQTAMTPNMLNTADPTMVPMPRSLSATKVLITFVKNSGELVPENRFYQSEIRISKNKVIKVSHKRKIKINSFNIPHITKNFRRKRNYIF